ncbi:MAG TPA: DUF2141 domain-containing protein [Crenotrichaceae bacterium]|nr:DUF2141 domain-containing protein [Crenotrichaceae bacterium]
MQLINRRLAVLTLSISLMILSYPIQGASLIVDVSGIDSAQGMVRVGLYDKAAGFPDEHQFMQGRVAPASDSVDGKLTVRFESVKPGDYAVAGYHDINNNDELDTNLLGIPDEPYGASRAARNVLSPPDYGDARFKLDAVGKRISIQFQ